MGDSKIQKSRCHASNRHMEVSIDLNVCISLDAAARCCLACFVLMCGHGAMENQNELGRRQCKIKYLRYIFK